MAKLPTAPSWVIVVFVETVADNAAALLSNDVLVVIWDTNTTSMPDTMTMRD